MSDDWIRGPRKLLRAVADLHARGYQRLRIMPYIGGPGAWRCMLAPAHHMSSRHGALLADSVDGSAFPSYTLANGREYWGWKDTHHATPSALTDRLVAMFPDLLRESYGQDWLYAGWSQHMLHLTYPDRVPVAADEYMQEREFLVIRPGEGRIPVPPPGYAQDVSQGERTTGQS